MPTRRQLGDHRDFYYFEGYLLRYSSSGGQEEISNQEVTVKDLKNRTQKKVKVKDIIKDLKPIVH